MLRAALLLPASLAVLLGCGNPAGLTVHNSMDSSIRVDGLGGAPVEIAAGQFHRMTPLEGSLQLTARGESFEESVSIPMPPEAGEALWSIGGKSCFVEGDYTSYYSEPANSPAAISVVGTLGTGENLYVSKGTVDAAPGQKLPPRMRHERVRALVRVPCDMIGSQEVARGWLEMTLEEIQPKGAKLHSPAL